MADGIRRLGWQWPLLLLVAAWCTAGYFHPDEHFQILEFASWKMGGTPAEALPWEFDARMRPGLQPLLTVGAIRLFRWIGLENPFIWAFLLRLMTAVGALWATIAVAKQYVSDAQRAVFIGLCTWLWFMPMLSVRFSSEQTAAIALLFSLVWMARKSPWNWWIAGFLLGLSFHFRYQMAFAGLGILAWLLGVGRPGWKAVMVWVVGGVAALLLGILADRWFYGSWVLAPWQYFYANLVEGKSEQFGVEPFWWYLPEFLLKSGPPIGIILLWGAVVAARRYPKHLMAWILVPFILGHSWVAHKELRFLFPVLVPFLLLAVQTDFLKNLWQRRHWRWFLLSVNSLLLVYATLLPLQPSVRLMAYLWQHRPAPENRLYAIGAHPYEWVGVPVWWYRPYGLSMEVYRPELDTRPDFRPGDWVVVQRPDETPVLDGLRWRLRYHVLPAWVRAWNVNDWQRRTKAGAVYEAY